MFRVLSITALAVMTVVMAACAGPGPGLTGNDTGGIIPWTPENQEIARQWADDHCARFGKIARITSIHRQYGDYITFACHFPSREPRYGS